ncbi:zinc metallopeptidase [candidate division KSB1 bacterium]|nr:zinc metallopeptidase [candidate division KSB1 bacterium]
MFGPIDLIILVPALLLSLYAQTKVRGAFKEMSRVRSSAGLTGAEVASSLLRRNGLSSVQVESIAGELSDHYDPVKKALRLSSSVYQSDSLAALGVAAHETGHALQHRDAYAPLKLRQAIFPMVRFGSGLWMPLFIGGLIFSLPMLIDIGIVLFAGAVAFHIVTLPVEFDASKRALAQLSSGGYLSTREIAGAKKVLDAAALTYVAAAAMAALQLLRLLLLRGND